MFTTSDTPKCIRPDCGYFSFQFHNNAHYTHNMQYSSDLSHIRQEWHKLLRPCFSLNATRGELTADHSQPCRALASLE